MIWSLAEGRRVDGRVLDGGLHAARYRLLGEVHDNPDHHEIQLTLLRSLAEAGLKPAVAFEQFDREHDAALRQRLAGSNVTADDIASAVNFTHNGGLELLPAAHRDRAPPWHAVAGRQSFPRCAQPIIKGGLEVLGAGVSRRCGSRPHGRHSGEHALRRVIFDGHCGALPERLLPAMAAAQRARDATLADAMLDACPDGPS